ncbi:adenosine receptor A2b-like [Stylophora pistillata]|uniref:adenosine receptor A2b-like n=1 Tax=Stylophora pistillata TaxID=50429 RepID=UPI000C046EC4|nr:adenosine receptor A2b-like [Stylophora pistillata]
MATTNLTHEDKRTGSFEELRCSSTFTSGIHQHLIWISAMNTFLSIISVVGNFLILAALRRESSVHPPSKLFLRCLAVSDLSVGLLAEPLNVIYWMSLVYQNWDLCRFASAASFMVGYVLASVSLFTLTAISVDRLLALLLSLRYKYVVTIKRTYIVVGIFWGLSTAAAVSSLRTHLITFWYSRIGISLCLTTSILSYTKIFITLLRRRAQVRVEIEQPVPSDQSVLNIARYKKAVYSALWIQMALVACYLPYSVVTALLSYRRPSQSFFLAWVIAVSLVYVNSSLNPILYCWKITEVRRAVKETIRNLLCCR